MDNSQTIYKEVSDTIDLYIKDYLTKQNPIISVANIKKLDSESVSKIAYMDTDSSFIVVDKLLYLVFKKHLKTLSKEIFDITIRKFEDSIIQENLHVTKEELVDIIQQVAQIFQGFINDKILPKFAEFWNIDVSYYKYLEYKQEFIFASLYIHSKKNYAFHQIAEKGIIEEVFDSLNLGKKSDRHPLSNKIVQEMFKEVQINSDLNSVYQKGMLFIRAYQKQLLQNLETAYVPASLNKNIAEYPTKNEVPRGALIYSILYDYDFKPGTKGRLYYVKKFNISDPHIKKNLEKIIQIGKKIWPAFSKHDLNVIFIPYDQNVNLEDFEINIQLQVEKALVDFLNVALKHTGIVFKI